MQQAYGTPNLGYRRHALRHPENHRREGLMSQILSVKNFQKLGGGSSHTFDFAGYQGKGNLAPRAALSPLHGGHMQTGDAFPVREVTSTQHRALSSEATSLPCCLSVVPAYAF